jgi:hypothetical protein
VLKRPPLLQPVSQIPVTDNLPPEGFSSPDSGYENATRQPVRDDAPPTRPRMVNPVSNLADTYRNQPLETDTSVPDNSVGLRPVDNYQTMPSRFGGNVAPVAVADTSARRDRLVKPVDPYQRAQENYNASLTAPPDYGQQAARDPLTGKVQIDPESGKPIMVQRTHGKEGFGGRVVSFLEGAANDYIHGGNALTALMSGGESAVDTNRNAEVAVS